MDSRTFATVRLSSLQDWREAFLLLIGYLGVYALGAAALPTDVSFYPASAVALVGLFFIGTRFWPVVLLGALLGSIGTHPHEPWLMVLFPVAETLQAFCGAYLFQKAGLDPLFRRYRDTFYLLVCVVLIAPIVPFFETAAAFLGNGTFSVSHIGYGYTAMVACLLIISPFLFRWITKPRFHRLPLEIVETLLVFFLLLGIDTALFLLHIPDVLDVPLIFILIIPFFWLALRLRPRFVSLALLITFVFSIVGAVSLHTSDTLASSLYEAEIFLITLGTAFFIIVSLEEDRRVNTNLMRSQLATLENAVSRVISESKMKNDFIAVLAHELRNPLAPVASGIDLLRLHGSTDPQVEATLLVMENRLATVRNLLDDLLDISRMTEGKMTLELKETNLETVLQRAMLSTAHYLKERHQSLTFRYPDALLYVMADPVRLEQVFSNLLANASKYSESGETISIIVRALDTEVEITVIDSGVGIHPDEQEAIFTAFHQSEQDTKTKKGLGIGLALVKSFIDMHGGSVTVVSPGPGQGSSFSVRLPLIAVPTTATPRPKKRVLERRAPANQGLLILVVDDNDAAAAGIGRLLELHGCRVAYAYDGQQAIQKVVSLSPDVVLLDIGLPDQDGYNVAKTMRSQGYEGKLIALTGYSTDDARERGRAAGFAEYLVKPVSLSDLKRVIGL